jgi:hypothetical protein
MAPDEARCVAACARRANHLIAASTPLVSRTRCGVLHAAPQSRDLQQSKHPDGLRISSAPRRPRHRASKTRVNALMALRSIRGTNSQGEVSCPTGPRKAQPVDQSTLPGSNYFAEADCSAGLPKTLRQPWLRLERCLCMQAVIRSTFGISDAQSRKTSPVQSRRWSSCVNAWLVAGRIARQKARPVTVLRIRSVNRSIGMVAPGLTDVAVAPQTVGRLGINLLS